MRTFRSLARLAATAAVPAALLLAACGDAPDPTAPATRPALELVGPGTGTTPTTPTLSVWVTLHVGDQAAYGGAYGVPGTTVSFVTNTGYYRTIVDNGAGDANPEVGYYRVAMPNALSYTAYVRVMPEKYSSAGAVKTVSAFVTPTLVNMGSIILKRKPGLHVQLLKQGALVPGQTIKVTQVNGPWSVTITDGSSADKDAFGNPNPSDGKIFLRVPFTGTYTVCALTSPSVLWAADCEPVYALQYFIAYSATLTYEPKLVLVTP